MPTEPLALAYDENSAPFFEAAARGELQLQYCATCQKFMWPVKYRCVHCFAADVTWRVASGHAVLYSLTVVHQTYPGFEQPYVVATVETREGVRFNTGLVGDDIESTPIGAELVVDFDGTGLPFPIPRFRRAA